MSHNFTSQNFHVLNGVFVLWYTIKQDLPLYPLRKPHMIASSGEKYLTCWEGGQQETAALTYLITCKLCTWPSDGRPQNLLHT